MRKGSGEIKKIGALFEKYRKTLRAPQKTVIATFCEVVDEVLGITMDESTLSYTPTSRILGVRGGGPLKSEIMLHKDEILAHVTARLGEQNAPKEIL